MRFSIRANTCDGSIGELTIEDGSTKLTVDYDRDDLAHELVNAYRDIFANDRDAWLKHLSMYIDDEDVKVISV